MDRLKVFRYGLETLLGRKKAGSINLLLTRDCNLRCAYCLYPRTHKGPLLTVDQWKRIIDRFAGRHYIFVFTGGEPLLYDGVDELIAYASDKGLTGLLTNALLLTEDHLKRFRRLDYLGFSIDWLGEPAVSPKSPVEKFELIRRYSEAYGFTVETSTILTPRNVDQIPRIVEFVDGWGFNFSLSLIHSGAANGWSLRADTPGLTFRTEEELATLRGVQSRLLEMKREGFRMSHPAGYLERLDRFASGESCVRCRAAENYFTINEDGFIMACQDMLPSGVHALAFDDYDEMRAEVRKTIPEGCRCWWDCHYLYDEIESRPYRFSFEKAVDKLRTASRSLRQKTA